jgi:hypothetical protein
MAMLEIVASQVDEDHAAAGLGDAADEAPAPATVNNFGRIRDLLSFDNPDAMYVIHVLVRRKDVPGTVRATKLLRTCYIRTLADYDRCQPGILADCDHKGARAYIDVNAKDVKKVALLALKKTAELIYTGDHAAVKNAYDHACGNVGTLGKTTLWLVDVDTRDPDKLRVVLEVVTQLGGEVRLVLPTFAGHHVLTTPFPLNRFRDERLPADEVTVLKRGLVLAYKPVAAPRDMSRVAEPHPPPPLVAEHGGALTSHLVPSVGTQR